MTMTECAPIFIHSGFRVASTWLWSHFRERSAFIAYYEIFNEDLATLTLADVQAKTWASWRSRHPETPPYFLEFLPLIKPEGGIRNFVPEPKFGARFIPNGGLDGTLYPEELPYIDGLISAVPDGKIPVLTCTRTLGKIAAIKKQFGGTHILLRRNLFRQWNSFSGQHRTGNLYFIVSVLNFIFENQKDNFFRYLAGILPDIGKISNSSLIENNYDDIFAIFVAWHIYLIIFGERSADIVINIDKITDTRDNHRNQVEKAISDATGQYVPLNDARDTIDLPWQAIVDVDSVRIKIDMHVERACSELNATAAEREKADIIVSDLWREHDRFALYSAIMTEQVAEVEYKSRQLNDSFRDEKAEHEKALTALKAQNIALKEGMAKQDQVLIEERQRGTNAIQLIAEQLAASYREIQLGQQDASNGFSTFSKAITEQTTTQAQILTDLIEQSLFDGRKTHELIHASHNLILQSKALAERLESAHAVEAARLNTELESVRAWGAANSRSLHRLIAEREREGIALEHAYQQNARQIIAITEEAADRVHALTRERDEARAESAMLKVSLMSAQQRNEEQHDALEAMLKARKIERASRAELAAERDAALRDQAMAFESRSNAIAAEIDGMRQALEQLQGGANTFYKSYATQNSRSIFCWLLPAKRLLVNLFQSR